MSTFFGRRAAAALFFVTAIAGPAAAQGPDMEAQAWTWLEEASTRSTADMPPLSFEVVERAQNNDNDPFVLHYRFDPAAPDGSKFVLLERNGEAPTPEDILEFAENRAGEEDNPYPDFGFNSDDTSLDDLREDFRLEEVTGEGAVFAFVNGVPFSGSLGDSDEDRTEISQNLAGSLRLALDGEGRAFVSEMRATLTDSFKPNLVSRVKAFELTVSNAWESDLGIIVPVRFSADTEARAFFKSFNAVWSRTYSNFAYAEGGAQADSVTVTGDAADVSAQ